MTASRQEQSLEVEGVRLHVVSEGEGDPVLILHGFTGSVESMACVSDRLREGFRVHRVDLVGHGGSESPALAEAFSMSQCVAQIRSLLDALELPSVSVIGYSMGGRVALSLAVAHPERVSRLVLVGASPGLADPAERAARRTADEALADRILREGLEEFVDQWMANPLFASQARLGEAALARARAERLRGSAAGLAGSLRGMGTGSMPPLHEDLPRLRLPVLCVVGEEDGKFRALGERMVTALPQGELQLIPSAGHAAHLEQPEAFAQAFAMFASAPVASADREGEG
ncbi:MAG: 2-succinyl-6-hydroxy-2,4-cyclohexadiene-1-carboxylate synthase [Myxococcota bacterium]|nr:2-succinyl-6-hydroxy-2,4-cyclohexadiene-1-carboxylate synthase [Myxococcota bacterium]